MMPKCPERQNTLFPDVDVLFARVVAGASASRGERP
jgi:hypothetical protein